MIQFYNGFKLVSSLHFFFSEATLTICAVPCEYLADFLKDKDYADFVPIDMNLY